MNRQQIRKLFLIASLLLFPITLYYFSPALIINAGLQGIINGSFIVFVLMLILSVPFGRFFCGYLCPAGGLQECVFLINGKSPRQGWKNYIKYIIWGVWLAAVLFGKRIFCHYFCWMAPFMILGTKLRRLLHLPGLHIRAGEGQCISCGKCSKACPMSIDVVAAVKEGGVKSAECIQCGACVDQCPHAVLSYGMVERRRKNNG